MTSPASAAIAAATAGAIRLERMATILAGGADVREFLQGQLSADLEQLTRERIRPASCNSPRGRVQAVLWLIERSDGLVLLLPEAMVETTSARLRKYVLRARAQLEPGSSRLIPYAVERGTLPPQLAPLAARTHLEHEDASLIAWPGSERLLLLAPADLPARSDSSVDDAWHLADIRAGLPQVYPQTHEAFVAQMLNLDLLGGVSFEKGCYTGQEIIARTHYRGSVKRRMFRFGAACPPPTPGTRVVAGAAHAGDVVDAAATDAGCELLAVISLAHLDAALTLEGEPATALQRLEMPYEISVA